MKNKQRFGDVAQHLHDAGYDITPLSGKRPVIDKWASIDADDALVSKWLNKYPRSNVGIQTRHTPAVDIDIYDADAAEEMEAWCLENLSDEAPVRVGQAPKRLLLFRTDEPFRKVKHRWVDEDGKEHAIEVLGAGQQFVAFGIHPDTKKPFEWTSIESPLDLAVDDLPELTREDVSRLMDAFDAMAKRRGWKPKGSKSMVVSNAESGFEDDDDALLGVAGKADDLDDADIRDALSNIDIDACDYDRWLTIGMALHHQYDGGDTGLELWDEWSTDSEHYDYDEIKAKWASFNVVRSGGKPTTIATVLKFAKENARAKAKDDFEREMTRIKACSDVDELFEDVAVALGKVITLPHQLQTAATALQSRMTELNGVKMPIADVRKVLTAASRGKGSKKGDVPEWVEDFVWVEGEDRFYSLSERKAISVKSYNARYDRHMLTPEDKAMRVAVPSTRAADAALTLYEASRVDGLIYLPGLDQIVQAGHGETYVNTYDDRDVPVAKKPKTDEERAALDAVRLHFRTLFPDDRERRILLSFLAHHVQNPTERVNWAVLVQGVEGAGKTWMQNLMAAVLGPKNVKPVKPTSLFADFNGWAEGSQMAFVEEIRLRGHDRFEVLDKIKDVITNDTIEVTRKGKDPVTRPNTQSYVLLTNWQDALALSDNDRRYFILRTALQNKRDLKAFLAQHPDHFANIFGAVAEHPEVLRWWLERMKLHEEFNAGGHAPDTESKRLMAALTGSDEQDAIGLLIEQAPFPDCSDYLLNITKLGSRLADMEGDFVVPQTRAMKAMLEQIGFTFIGKFRVEGRYQRFYTRRPDLFRGKDDTAIGVAVRMILDGEEPELI